MQYDLTVHMNADGLAVLCHHTDKGKEFIDSTGTAKLMLMLPDEFELSVPPDLLVGYVCPESGQVVQMSKNSLQ